MKNLCLAGGVALNCVANGRILREGPFDRHLDSARRRRRGRGAGRGLVHLASAAGQAARRRTDWIASVARCSGPASRTTRFAASSTPREPAIAGSTTKTSLCDDVADLIASEKVVGWLQGRMEFGPRALGGRSILGDARSTRMQSVMNLKIKFRESFRPFAPSVLEERVDEYFEMRPHQPSPYMLLVAPVRGDKRLPLTAPICSVAGIDKLRTQRSVVPAITHVDYSARVQTVDCDRHGRY